jgi:hypothetical protein
MANLYEITDKYRDLFIAIEEAEGELTPEMEKELDITKEELEDKIHAYFSVIEGKKASNDVIKKRVAKMKLMQNANDRVVERLKARVLDAVREFGYEGKSGNRKLDFDTLKVYTKTTAGLEFENEEEFRNPLYCMTAINVPTDDKIIKAMIALATKLSKNKDTVVEANKLLKNTINKKAVSAALTLNKKVPGAKIVNKETVVIG